MKSKKTSKKAMVRQTLFYYLKTGFRIYPGYFAESLFHVILRAVVPFAQIMVLPMIMDELMGERNLGKIALMVFIMIMSEAVVRVTSELMYQRVGINGRYDYKFQNYFTLEIGKRVMELDFQLTEDKKALDQIEAARTGMGGYSGGMVGIWMHFFDCITSAIQMIGVITLIAIHAPWLLVLTLILLFVNAWIQNRRNHIEVRYYPQQSRIDRLFDYLGWTLIDFRYGKDIRLYEAQDMMKGRWERFTNHRIDLRSKQANELVRYDTISSIVSVLRDFATYFYLGAMAILGKITIGIFSQMIVSAKTLSWAAERMIRDIQEIVKRSGYAYEFVKFMDYPPALEKGNRSVRDGEHTFVFEHVTFRYPGTEDNVLEDVNLTLPAGEHLSVVGLNGAGKTTFIKLLLRLYDVTEGAILLDGVNIKEYDYKEYMGLFAPVFQDFKLFAVSFRENITRKKECSEEELEEILKKVGLIDKVKRLPKGADTVLFKYFDEDGIEPSGGEQQKLAIARALFKRAPVVILDEPTAALDPVAEYEIYCQFHELVGQKTAVYISHRLSSCRFCDHIAVFHDKSVAEYGTHEELVKKKDGIYAKMFFTQAEHYVALDKEE